jgi:thioredoxin-related protein
MKRLSLLSVVVMLLVSIVATAQPSAPAADELLKEAYQQAAKENKNVFIMFHASWCGWCHKMDKSINDAACKKFFADSYVICHLVVDEAKDKKNENKIQWRRARHSFLVSI